MMSRKNTRTGNDAQKPRYSDARYARDLIFGGTLWGDVLREMRAIVRQGSLPENEAAGPPGAHPFPHSRG